MRNGSVGLPQIRHLAVSDLVAFNGRGILELLLGDCISHHGRSHGPVVEIDLEHISESRGFVWKSLAFVDLMVCSSAS